LRLNYFSWNLAEAVQKIAHKERIAIT